MACRGTVFVIDDDPDIRESLKDYLEGCCGCTVTTASDGVDALRRLDGAQPPCFVLVDVNMPGMGGETFARHVRAERPPSALPIVSMSAGDGPMSSGESHLPKPLEIDALNGVVTRYCRDCDRCLLRSRSMVAGHVAVRRPTWGPRAVAGR